MWPMMVQGFSGCRPCILSICIMYGDMSVPMMGALAMTPILRFLRCMRATRSFETSYSTNSWRSGSKNSMTSSLPSSVVATRPKKNASSAESWKRLTP